MGWKGWKEFCCTTANHFYSPFYELSRTRGSATEECPERDLAPCVAHPTRSVVKRYLSPILRSPLNARVNKDRKRSESGRPVSLKNLRR